MEDIIYYAVLFVMVFPFLLVMTLGIGYLLSILKEFLGK